MHGFKRRDKKVQKTGDLERLPPLFLSVPAVTYKTRTQAKFQFLLSFFSGSVSPYSFLRSADL
jgi:hypothetical protein